MITYHEEPIFDLCVGSFKLDCIRPLIRLDGQEEHILWRRLSPGVFAGQSDAGLWEYQVRDLDGKIQVSLSGKLNHPVDLGEYFLLDVPVISGEHLAAQGLRMGGCELRKLDQAGEKPFSSFYHCVISQGEESLMFSMPLLQKQPGRFCGTTARGKVTGFRGGYEVSYYGGTEVELDPITLEAGNGFDLLERWAEANVEEPKTFPEVSPVGWNSWDNYRWTITEEEVLKNADFIAHDPVLSKHVKRIIVDDGWQYCYGEWEANCFFPHGMEYLARELTKMGFEPGLWFAPSVVEPHSPIAQIHPEMLALSKGGQPCLAYECMRRQGMVLDPTVPKTQEHLRRIFDRYAGMGYKYFKLDFLQTTLNAPRFHDASVPRSEIVRRLVTPIYEAVKGRSQILGCNYPFLAGNHLVDAVRIGSDIHAIWNCIKSNTVSVASRFWANRRLWINDPDFACCRGVETSDDPMLDALNPLWVFVEPGSDYDAGRDMKLATATKNEIEVLLGVVMQTAGAINFSDDMTHLNAAGLKLARQLVEARSGQTGRPLDLFSSELPTRWLQRLNDGGRRLMLVNWEDAPQTVELDLKSYGFTTGVVRDFYREETLSLPLTGASIELPPHSCKILETLEK